MKTAYYTLTTQDALSLGESLERASGEERQTIWIRQPAQTPAPRGGNNVIDLAAWKAAREQEALEEAAWQDAWCDEDEPDWLLETDEAPAAPVRRPRREHPALLRGELAATLSVIGATAALVLRFLAF